MTITLPISELPRGPGRYGSPELPSASPDALRSVAAFALPAPAPRPDGPQGPTAISPPPPRASRRRQALAVLSLLALLALAASFRWTGAPPLLVQTTRARRGTITRVVSAAGKLRAAAQVKLSASVSGELVELGVREGDRVRKGQVLGRIDPRRFGAQVAQQEASRSGAAAEAQLEAVRVRELERELARVKSLGRTGDASAAEIDRARSNLGAERARLRSAEERVEQARGALTEVQHTLSQTVLTSPIDGVVTQREKQVGERVRGADLSEDIVLVVSSLSSMEARMEVGEREVIFVKRGDAAGVEIDALPDRRFPAQVVEVARHATVKDAGTEGEVTTYEVRLELATPLPPALPGMSARATIATETHEGAVVVPLQAVAVRPVRELAGSAQPTGEIPGEPVPEAAVNGRPARGQLRKCVFVVQRGVARVRPVETGIASETEIEITSGLTQGEEVVTGPYRLLYREISDGRRVAAR